MLPTDQGRSRVDEFLAKVTKKPEPARGSIVFALDATGSREPTWDLAVDLQAKMFSEVTTIGALDTKLIFFHGTGRDAECRASEWIDDPTRLAAFMNNIQCRPGVTQIARVLDHVLHESSQRKINAVIFVGDACEEPRNHSVPLARRLADLGIPIFVFQEGRDLEAELVFREIAQITNGAFCRFDQGSARQLSELLRAVAAFAVGGVAALEHQSSGAAKLLLQQIR